MIICEDDVRHDYEVVKRVRFGGHLLPSERGGEESFTRKKYTNSSKRQRRLRRIEFEFELLRIPSYVHRDLNLILIP